MRLELPTVRRFGARQRKAAQAKQAARRARLAEVQGMIPAVAKSLGVCALCGRQLSRSASVTRGYGPTCWARVCDEVGDQEAAGDV